MHVTLSAVCSVAFEVLDVGVGQYAVVMVFQVVALVVAQVA